MKNGSDNATLLSAVLFSVRSTMPRPPSGTIPPRHLRSRCCFFFLGPGEPTFCVKGHLRSFCLIFSQTYLARSCLMAVFTVRRNCLWMVTSKTNSKNLEKVVGYMMWVGPQVRSFISNITIDMASNSLLASGISCAVSGTSSF